MDAASELAFDRLAFQAGRKLWPGKVKLAGVEYAAVVAREKVLISMGSHLQAGAREVEGIRVEIAKTALAACPLAETPLAYDGAVYLVKETDGHAPTDAAWFLVCAKSPGSA